MSLIRLPVQPAGTEWPTREWPVGAVAAGIDGAALKALLDTACNDPQPAGTSRTHGLLVVHRGRIVAERYAPEFGPYDTQPSWSMAKSMLHAVVGILCADGRLDVAAPAPVPQWQRAGDPRAAITLDSLLHMTSGLHFIEDYVQDATSDVIKMLLRPGAADMAAFAAGFPADFPPDTVFNYSSGTSNIISGVVGRIVGNGDAYREFLRRALFDRIGMASALPRFDRSGAWIASSYCFCTPQDFARFGLLYLRDGVWEGNRILPPGWVDYARTPGPVQPSPVAAATPEEIQEEALGYGAHWWLWQDDLGTFSANGYAGQFIVLVPALDLIVVRNGDTPAERRPHVIAQLRQIIDLFRTHGG